MPRIWGIPIPAIGPGSGNVTGAGTTTSGAVALWSNTNGTGLANSSILSSDGSQLLVATRIGSGFVTIADNPTMAIDASAGNTFFMNATTDVTVSVPTNPPSGSTSFNGQRIIIMYRTITTTRTLTLTTGSTDSFLFGSDITTLTATTGNTMDMIGCVYVFSIRRWCVVSYVKGFA